MWPNCTVHLHFQMRDVLPSQYDIWGHWSTTYRSRRGFAVSAASRPVPGGKRWGRKKIMKAKGWVQLSLHSLKWLHDPRPADNQNRSWNSVLRLLLLKYSTLLLSILHFNTVLWTAEYLHKMLSSDFMFALCIVHAHVHDKGREAPSLSYLTVESLLAHCSAPS